MVDLALCSRVLMYCNYNQEEWEGEKGQPGHTGAWHHLQPVRSEGQRGGISAYHLISK